MKPNRISLCLMALCFATTLMTTLMAQTPSMSKGETWLRKATMPTPRRHLATCFLDGKIYALGGSTVAGAGGLITVEAYDPAADSWNVKAPMVTARGWFGAEAVNGRIYAIGGDGVGFLSAPLKSVEEYNPATDAWVPRTSMPTAREGFATAVVDGKIYVIGGLTGRGAPALSTVEAYIPATDSWERKKAMPTARGMLCASVVDGKIFAIGAAGPGQPILATVEMYDPATDTWTRKASMPTARGIPTACTAHGRIYVMGGRTPDTAFALIQEFDPFANTWIRRTNIWARSPSVSVPLFGFGAIEVSGKIYLIGGASEISVEQGLSQVLEYTPPVIAPQLKLHAAINAGLPVLRLEWPSHSDYMDLLQVRRQVDGDNWFDVETLPGRDGTISKEFSLTDTASFYRLRRTIK